MKVYNYFLISFSVLPCCVLKRLCTFNMDYVYESLFLLRIKYGKALGDRYNEHTFSRR
jgi:hypothetical protein